MKSLIVATALGIALLSMPATAQDRSGTPPGTGTGTGTGADTGTGIGTGRMSDPSDRLRSETERRRSFDRQRDTSPMTNDPRLGPGVGSGSSGGLGAPSTGGNGTSR